MIKKSERVYDKEPKVSGQWAQWCMGKRSTCLIWRGFEPFKKDIKVTSRRTLVNIIITHDEYCDKLFVDKRINITRDNVNILHHLAQLMNNGTFVRLELLLPTFKLVDTLLILEYFLNSTTITQPIYCNTPKIFRRVAIAQ